MGAIGWPGAYTVWRAFRRVAVVRHRTDTAGLLGDSAQNHNRGVAYNHPKHASMIRRLIRAQGIVQGVGFRPFVYKLAVSNGLAGYVANSSAGVTVEIEGDEAKINTFLREF